MKTKLTLKFLCLLFSPFFIKAQYSLSDVARFTRTDYLHRLGLTGKGMTIYIFEPGLPHFVNRQFEGRLEIEGHFSTGSAESRLHATMVAGVVLSGGKFIPKDNMKGMAYEARGISNNGKDEMRILTSEERGALFFGLQVPNIDIILSRIDEVPYFISQHPDALVSNHSNSSRLIKSYGSYNDLARKYDSAMYKLPFWLAVVAAGNDGEETNPSAHMAGYELIKSDYKCSKNTLTVANASEVVLQPDGTLMAARLHSTSSPGPTGDLRIKPDITGFGSNIYSCGEEQIVVIDGRTETNFFSVGTGTSVAAPNVAGTLLLLQQHFKNLFGHYMRAATLKGLALHTADFMNTTPGQMGPDARSGWGLLNAKFAGEVLTDRNVSSIIEEIILPQEKVFTIKVKTSGLTPFKVSISWTDPQGTYSQEMNSSESKLVNDLDVVVLGEKSLYKPYLLQTPSTTGTGDNTVDPYERVDINTPQPGEEYTIKVSHKGTLVDGVQNFSLIITGLGDAEKCLATARIIVPVMDPGEVAARNILAQTEINTNQGKVAFRVSNEIVLNPGVWIHKTDFHGFISDCFPLRPAVDAIVSQSAKPLARQAKTITEQEDSRNHLTIYPNPFSQSVIVSLTGNSEIKKIQLFNTEGIIVMGKKYGHISQVQLNTSGLKPGVYFISVTKGDGTMVKYKMVRL